LIRAFFPNSLFPATQEDICWVESMERSASFFWARHYYGCRK
jgi:hypothetical protein